MMIAQKPNHFTCTIAEALEWNKAHFNVKTEQTAYGTICRHDEFKNIPEFVEFLAKNYGQSLAIGCVTPKSTLVNNTNELVEELLTFEEVHEQSFRLSQHFIAQFGPCKPERKCVALMASSSVVYALIWLALIRAGYEVLLFSSRNPSNASRHLLNISKAFAVCYDQDHQQDISDILLATNNSEDLSPLPLPNLLKFKIPWLSLKSLVNSSLDTFDISSALTKKQDLTSIAFHNQSSGTTGLPKLISQTHNGQVAVLPRLQDQDVTSLRQSTFTTTPLCTGGIADLLRSWSAATPIWLFPENRAPIIGKFVLAFFRQIDALSLSSTLYPKFRLAYLSCVPFVLESLIENPELKSRLFKMNAIGVGGAAMSTNLGDQLVSDGLPIVSRFGSSECGFLLSSHRDYKKDHFWQALRKRNSTGLNFRCITAERYELTVEADWPLISTALHALRPFNTHDVFTPYDSISNSWRYIGRSDSLLTLRTGKKFDPEPLEEALNCHPFIRTAFIVGNDRPYPVAIIFRVSEKISIDEEQRNQQIWCHIQQVNKNQPPHAKILQNNFRVLDSSHQSRIKKNNKGGLIRGALIKEFEKEIKEIYESSQTFKNGITNIFSAEKIFHNVQVAVNSIVKIDYELNPNDDLFDAGVDSVMSLQIRKSICDMISPELRSSVPQNIVYECGTISSLADFFIELLISNKKLNTDLVDETKSRHTEMRSMVEMNLDIQQKSLEQLQQSKFVIGDQFRNQNIVALTGATGFLGIHILDNLMRDTKISKIYLLLRGSLIEPYNLLCKGAEVRVRSRLDFYKINVDKEFFKKIIFVPFQLKEIDLGVPSSLYIKMATEITHVIHAAWDVNFNLSLRNFAPQIKGTLNLFNLLLLGSVRDVSNKHQKSSFLFCSSVASVAHMPETNMPSFDPEHAFNLGYSQSKWVAEAVLTSLSKKCPMIATSIIRVGQLSGDTKRGIWNPREAWPLMFDASLFSFSGVAKFPDLASLSLSVINWLPVDLAAKAICETTTNNTDKNIEFLQISNRNSRDHITWHQFQSWFCSWAKAKGIVFNIVEAKVWLEELEEQQHKAKALIPLWRKNWQRDEAVINPLVVINGIDNKILCEKYIWRLLNSIYERRNPSQY